MFKKGLTAVALVALTAATATAQDAKTVIGNASKAMGENLKTVEFSASGTDYALGQNYNPSSPWPKFIDKTYTRAINYQVPATKMGRIRMQGENPARGGGNQPILGEQKQNQTVIVAANTPWVQQLDIWMTPHGFLQAAAANNATVKAETVGGKKYQVVTFMGQNKAKVNGYINEQNMVEKVETWIDNTVLGDMLFEAVYSDYKDFGGYKFPTRMIQRQGGHPILDLLVTEVKPNAPVTIEPAPAGGPGGGAPAAAATEKLGDGVWLVTGGYGSVIVDFKDYIVIIEGPTNDARAVAIMDEAKKLIPNKPIRYVVATHHHFDHSGGLRAFVAEGATVITHEVNKPFFEQVFSLPHTLNPDRLAMAKKAPTFETMTEKKVLTDGTKTIELHHVSGFGHHEGMIMAYLPKEKILIEADGYNSPPTATTPPPATPSPYNLALLANMDRLKLETDRIIPIHLPPDGRKITKADVLRAVGQSTGN